MSRSTKSPRKRFNLDIFRLRYTKTQAVKFGKIMIYLDFLNFFVADVDADIEGGAFFS